MVTTGMSDAAKILHDLETPICVSGPYSFSQMEINGIIPRLLLGLTNMHFPRWFYTNILYDYFFPSSFLYVQSIDSTFITLPQNTRRLFQKEC
jgi:hypothetical protein